jgi:putative ABC transport system permease protein
MRTPPRGGRLWLRLALRFIRRHRRKSLATGSYIFTGAAILVLIHAITVGISDTMISNTTSLHYGAAFTEVRPGGEAPETLASEIERKGMAETALVRYRFVSIIKKGSAFAPSVSFAVQPRKESGKTAISHKIIRGRYPSGREILLGKPAAESLKADIGDEVTVFDGTATPVATLTVSGVFSTAIDRYDEGISFMPVGILEKEFLRKQTAEISLFFKKGEDIPKAIRHLKTRFDLPFRSWEELMPDLVQLIRLNSVSTKIIMFFVFLLVGFGLSNTFILTTVERFKEFGILKAMGVRPGELILLIFLESFLLCLSAGLLGIGVGWIISVLTAHYGIDLASLTSNNRYFVVSGVVKPRVTASGIYLPFIISLVISTLSSYLPARIASKRITAETLRFQ